ncbi:MAG: DNA polymerase III subunit delta' [Beijerinckiaceae bacterium]|nr:DNA polymerase III subunit delta' [Beijerinckiaceae bacterium]
MKPPRLQILPRLGEESEEPDRLGDLPHPREMLDLVGHQEQERDLLDAYRSGRMHHAWIVGGEEGIGKATLAYRFARFVLAHPDPTSPSVRHATTLEVDADARAAKLVASQAHPDLAVLRRGPTRDGKSFSSVISVEDMRGISSLFRSTAGAGGWRIAIVDSADDFNASSANALLKMLEEPPERSIFIIVSHAPGRLMPTIRSRCRTILLRPLSESDVARVVTGVGEPDAPPAAIAQAASLSKGSVARAFKLLDEGMLALRTRLKDLFERLPAVDDKVALALAEATTKRDGLAFEQFVEAAEDYLGQAVSSRAARPAAALQPFAELHEKLSAGRREVDAYNLDRRPLVLATISGLAEAVRKAGG